MSEIKQERIETVIRSAKTPIRKDEMVKIHEHFASSKNEREESYLTSFCRETNRSLDDFYYLPQQAFFPYCYFKDGAFMGFNLIDEAYFEMVRMKQSLASREAMVREASESGDYGQIFTLTETIGRMLVFEHFFPKIPVRKKYELFLSVYIHQEYGFSYYSDGVIEEALSSQPEESRAEAQSQLKRELGVDSGAEITIYRGMGEASTPLEKTMSWTLSEKTAYYFANRLGIEGYVVRGKVLLEHVIDYVTSRNEQEVLVLPEHVQLQESNFLIKTNDEMERLNQNGLVKEFQAIRQHLLPSDAFLHPEGIHGVHHTKRVLLHCLSLSNAIGLTDVERGILSSTAIYHDIGRKHDDECTRHGQWSVEKRRELELPMTYVSVDETGFLEVDELTEEEVEVVEFLMTYHCRSDKEAENALVEMEEGEIKDIILKLLPIFKDADALDRVRISDLDARYLRTKEARQRLGFAEDVLRYLE